MIGFALLVVQISWVVAGHNICIWTTNESTEFLRIEKLNQFSVNLHEAIAKNSIGNLVITPISAWRLVEKKMNEDVKCHKSLSTMVTRMYDRVTNDEKRASEIRDKEHITLKKTMKSIQYYTSQRNTSFEGKLYGVMNPQIMKLFLFVPNSNTPKKVTVMDFLIKSFYPLYLPFNTKFVVLSLGSKLKMTIVLPNEGMSFTQAEQLLRDAQIQGSIIPTSAEQIIRVQLPVIDVHSKVDMTNSLTQFGLGNMLFNHEYFLKYNSTGLITSIIQNTTIHVKGFSKVVEEKMYPKKEFFIVQRPFLVEISDDDVIIFKGRVVDFGE